MGLYYQPPMPNMGGQQPATAAELTPQSGPMPQNPPINGGAKVQEEALIAWLPPAPHVQMEEPAIVFPQTAPQPRANWWKIEAQITAWIPPAPQPIATPPVPMSAPPPVPPIPPNISRLLVLFQGWLSVDPATLIPGPYEGNAQPYAQVVCTPPISAMPPSAPPVVGGGLSQAIVNSWIPPDPMWQSTITLKPPSSSDRPIVTPSARAEINAWDILTPGGVVGAKRLIGVSFVPPSPQQNAVVRVTNVDQTLPLLPAQGRLPASSDILYIRSIAEFQAWLSTAPETFLYDGEIENYNPSSGPTGQNPPTVGSIIPAAVLDSWIFSDPKPQWAINIVPFIGPEPPHQAPSLVPQAVINAWIPPEVRQIFQQKVSPPSSDAASGPTSKLPVIIRAWDAPEVRQIFVRQVLPSADMITVGGRAPAAVLLSWDAVPVPVPPAQPKRPVVLSADQPVIGSTVPLGVLAAWLPADAAPTLVRFSPQSGLTPTRPPFYRSNVEISDAWIPAQAQPYLQSQPYQNELISPPVSGPGPTNPPFVGGAAVPQAVLLSWIIPPPDQHIVLLVPPAPPLPSNPPVTGPHVPDAVLVSWRLPEPLPKIVIVSPQGGTAPSTPPRMRGGAHVPIDAWIPPPPDPIVRLPGYPVMSADSAPIGTRVPAGAIEAWNAPAPAPVVRAPGAPASSDRPPPPRQVVLYPEPVQLPVPAIVMPIGAPQPVPPLQVAVMDAWLVDQAAQTVLPKIVIGAAPNVPPIVQPVAIWNAWLPAEQPALRRPIYLVLQAPVINAPIPHSSQFWSILASWAPQEVVNQYGAHVVTLLQLSYVLNPNLIATARPRRMIATVFSNIMARTNDLGPAIDSSVEQETATFDFGPILAPGVSIAYVVSLTCVAYLGVDAAASSRLLGPSATGPSPATFAPSAAVYQLVGNMLAGVTYRLQCVVKTTDGQTPSAWTHLQCVAPN